MGWVMRAVMKDEGTVADSPNPLAENTPARELIDGEWRTAKWMEPKFEYVREWVDD